MKKIMKSFRIDDDTVYDMERMADRLGWTQTELIENAIDFFYRSGAASAVQDLQEKNGKQIPYKAFADGALSGGKVRESVRLSIGLGVAPMVYQGRL